MKCILMAGGAGDRLWPLSRKTYPKQFLDLGSGFSAFQETITRNLPFCDGFFVLTNKDYKDIVLSQLNQFQSLEYTLVMEEKGRGTMPPLAVLLHALSCDEEVLVVPSDLYIEGENYSQSIYEAKTFCEKNQLVVFGTRPENPTTAYGYIQSEGDKVTRFMERPSKAMAGSIFSAENTFWNAGLLMGKAGVLLEQLKKYEPGLYVSSRKVYESIKEVPEADSQKSENKSHEVLLGGECFNTIPKISIERAIIEPCEILRMVALRCVWKDISDFDSLEKMRKGMVAGPVISRGTNNTRIINNDKNTLVVVNDLNDSVVVNTSDAVYVTGKEHAGDIKELIADYHKKYPGYFDENPLVYRKWGIREMIQKEEGYRVRKVVIYPGKEIYTHIHTRRNENYSVVRGELSVELEDNPVTLVQGENIYIPAGLKHRLFNVTDEDVILIEVDTGDEITEADMKSRDELDAADVAKTADYEKNSPGLNGKLQKEEELPAMLFMEPVFKDYLWGGSLLKELFGKKTPYDITAESWELSAHEAGPSRISGGAFSGRTFPEFLSSVNEHKVCGWKSRTFDRFPIMIKFIDAMNPLSVQVHPSDDYAFIHEGEFGKNEMWYIMDAKPDATLYCGLKQDVPKEQIKTALQKHEMEVLLNKVPVKSGDVFFIPAGTIHAIGAGILLCEIQQNSNSTYRLWDYDRKDKDGNLRPLHVEKALDVADTSRYRMRGYGYSEPEETEGGVYQTLCRCKYFQVEKYMVREEQVISMDESSFLAVVVIQGEGALRVKDERRKVKAGDTVFLPAGRKLLHIEGDLEVLAVGI